MVNIPYYNYTVWNDRNTPANWILFDAVFQTAVATNLLRCLNLPPYLNNSQGIGISGSDRKANTLPAQFTPSFSYIWMVNKGNTAPSIYRSMPFAASATCG